ncbi:DUF2690 domain-containing protein [Micromonospora sp. KC213]|uniref:DUF2690 domain-containing protein n=1 Tax=Micromonospora sp. KC213 TaxID=2530378 RepID=UPI001045AB37|nr:DUF2690 domain-containing protein [Micromonospora sp. KC213]TDC38518.1 DUF2690 domain-containing protein [Micromonospora sp. KC213]
MTTVPMLYAPMKATIGAGKMARKTVSRLRRAMATSAFLLTALLAAPGLASAAPTTDPDTCRNGGGSGYLSCNGKDPVKMGCSGSTVADGVAKNGVYIELRYSSSCQAYWTRYTNDPGSAGEARIKSTTGSLIYRKNLAAYKGETGWTPMMAANQRPEGCLFFYYAPFSEYMEYCPR